MNNFIAALKKIRFSQILMVFMAGVLLFVSTACGGPGGKTEVQTGTRQEMPAGKQGVPGQVNPRPEVPGGTATSPSSDVINRFEPGTMNEFSDLDPRTKQGAAAADKAEALKENAERNVIDQTGNLGENTKRILDKKGENVEDLGKNVNKSVEDTKNKAQGVTDDLVQGTKQATDNVKGSAMNATKGMSRSVNQAAEDAKQTVKGNISDTRELTKGVKQAADGAKEDTKVAGRNLVDDAQQAIENTGEFVQNKLNAVTKATLSNVDKAGNAVNDVVK